ncbi:MAG: DNA-binding response regulator, partial [Cyanobacteria bacterium J06588_5]
NVEQYVSRLFGKTGTNSRTELVRYALENGLVTT